MKLTPRQIDVLRLMADGWEMPYHSRALVKGGEKHPYAGNTFWSLYDKKLIERLEDGSNWVLTEAGRQEAERIWKVKP